MAMATPTQTWTISTLIGAFIDLSLAFLLLCGATLAFAASTFFSLFGLSLPLPIDGLFGHPTATIASVNSSLRSRPPLASILCPVHDDPDSPQFTGLRHRKGSSPLSACAEDAGLRGSGRTHSLGNEGILIRELEQALEEEQAARAALYIDLEKERSAAATAADEAMAMILRLQEEKAAVKMEARQFRRMVEEKYLYDDEEMEILKEIVLRREMEKHFLEKELEGCRLQDDAKDAGQKVSDSSQFEAELRVLDVYAIDDRLNLADGGNDKDADLSRMRSRNAIYGKVGPVLESPGTNMIGTYINPGSDSGYVEQNVSRSSSDMTSAPRLMDTLCHEPSPFNLRRSSMSAISNERSRLGIEVELLRKRLESVQQGRERLGLTREHKEDESFQLHLLEEIACQLQETRKTTEPERNVHQALLPPLSSKVVSKKRSCHSVSWGLEDST